MVSSAPDAELDLIARAQDGDRQAFADLVRTHRQGVVAVAYRLCGDIGAAEDAAQEAFLRAWRGLRGYQPRSPFRNWLYRIATNVTLDTLRRDRRPVPLQDELAADPEHNPERAAERHERSETVRRAVLALPPACRSVLVLREYEGLSYAEIADTLQIPMGTVMSRLSYARGLMRRSLAALMEVG
ncbi:MAG: RNA polymerase sigma factor [Anaerolineae bacterium]